VRLCEVVGQEEGATSQACWAERDREAGALGQGELEGQTRRCVGPIASTGVGRPACRRVKVDVNFKFG
jgi:hypothetical protein